MFADEIARQAENVRRRRGRNVTLLSVLLGFSALLYALTVVKLF